MPSCVTTKMNNFVSTSFTENEVTCALFQMNPLRALRPDGFPAHNFKNTRLFLKMMHDGLYYRFLTIR